MHRLLQLGYNTNGLADHALIDAVDLVAEIGYQGVAITLNHGALNPYDDRTDVQLEQIAGLLDRRNLQSVIETGARYLLDPRSKHEPTLVSPDPEARARRVDFLCRAIDIAALLGSRCVSLWSGTIRDRAGDGEAMGRLVESLVGLLDYAARKNVVLAFEPEPGMFIDTLGRYADLVESLEARRMDESFLSLTIDVGHLHCQGEVPVADHIRRWASRLANVHIEDMRQGIHEHLMFGEGEIDFPPVFAALADVGYTGLVNVELSRHSHEGPTAARRAFDFLWPLCEAAAKS